MGPGTVAQYVPTPLAARFTVSDPTGVDPALAAQNAMWRCTVQAIRGSLGYMPDTPYRDFCAWILDHPRHARSWLQLVAVAQLVRLGDRMLGGLLSAAELEAVAPYAGIMNAYQMYEVVSDHLAMGLGERTGDDATFDVRAQLLGDFDAAMVARLDGESADAVRPRMLALAPAARHVSVFRQSLDEQAHALLADAFLAAHPGVAAADLEYALLPMLIANIESAAALVDTMSDAVTADLLGDGLRRRYRAVDQLVSGPAESEQTLVALGAAAILVVPTLAYYAGVIAEIVRPLKRYGHVLADGTLAQALQDAAIAVRVLNDCGTALVEQSPRDRARFVERLRALAADGGTVGELLRRAHEHSADGLLLTRIAKDLDHAEFNLCLDGIRGHEASPASVDAFAGRLTTVTDVYRRARRSLDARAREMAGTLGDSVLSDLVLRFVEFHRFTYAHAFETEGGEYAVLDAQRIATTARRSRRIA
ncbi:MAG: hypothetical protein V7607_2625 [Solirubrobacteraceae bacterium]